MNVFLWSLFVACSSLSAYSLLVFSIEDRFAQLVIIPFLLLFSIVLGLVIMARCSVARTKESLCKEGRIQGSSKYMAQAVIAFFKLCMTVVLSTLVVMCVLYVFSSTPEPFSDPILLVLFLLFYFPPFLFAMFVCNFFVGLALSFVFRLEYQKQRLLWLLFGVLAIGFLLFIGYTIFYEYNQERKHRHVDITDYSTLLKNENYRVVI